MKAGDLIKYLSVIPEDAEVYIQDADTGWFLPVHIGRIKHEYIWDVSPKGLILHGEYGEELDTEKDFNRKSTDP